MLYYSASYCWFTVEEWFSGLRLAHSVPFVQVKHGRHVIKQVIYHLLHIMHFMDFGEYFVMALSILAAPL